MEQQPEIFTLSDPGPINLGDLWVELCSFKDAAPFVVEHHYTHSVKGMTPSYCFLVRDRRQNTTVGAALFGTPGQVQTTNKYNGWGGLCGRCSHLFEEHKETDEKKGKLPCQSTGCENYVAPIKMVELRRLVLLDACPKNSESNVIGVMLRLLKKAGIQRVLSYADPNEKRAGHPDGKHTGLIYRATGFHQVKEAGKTKAIWFKGRRYPIRNIDQYNNYREKPHGWDEIPDDKKILRYEKDGSPVWVPKVPSERIALNVMLRAALADGTAELRSESGKIGYVKDLEKGMEYFDTPTPKQGTRKFSL